MIHSKLITQPKTGALAFPLLAKYVGRDDTVHNAVVLFTGSHAGTTVVRGGDCIIGHYDGNWGSVCNMGVWQHMSPGDSVVLQQRSELSDDANVFPILARLKETGEVVLFSFTECGTVVYAPDTRPLGHYSKSWVPVHDSFRWEILAVGDSITLVVRADGGLTALQTTAIR